MLTPTSISGNSVIASRKAKRGWLRNSRWLYSNSLSVLFENNKAVERQQIFADILGFGHLASTLRDLRGYRKPLPNTEAVVDSISRVSAEIELTESEPARSSTLREKATEHLATIFNAIPPAVDGSLSNHLGVAQVAIFVQFIN
jgi:exonuclease SbcC